MTEVGAEKWAGAVINLTTWFRQRWNWSQGACGRLSGMGHLSLGSCTQKLTGHSGRGPEDKLTRETQTVEFMTLPRGLRTPVGNWVNGIPVMFWPRIWLHLYPEDLSGVEFKCKD